MDTKTGEVYRGVVLRSNPPIEDMEKINIRNVAVSPDYTPYPESNPQVGPCRCDDTSIASWMRRRANYHFSVVDCAMAQCSEAKFIPHQRHRSKHIGTVCRCSINAVRLPLRGVARYHFDSCAFPRHGRHSVEGRKKPKRAGRQKTGAFQEPQIRKPDHEGSKRGG